jgi:hypothetical protein
MRRAPARCAPDRLRRRRRRAAFVALLLASLAAPASGRNDPVTGPSPCLRIDRITAFAPRGEVYVELHASCGPQHFVHEDSLVAYVEVLPSDLPPVGEDVRVFEEHPRGRTTLLFRNLSLASGDVVLVRLLRLGEILGLQSVRVP